MKILSMIEMDEKANERIYLTPEQKIIQISDVHQGMTKLAFIQALCRQITDAGSIQTFEAVAACYQAAHDEIMKEKPVEEMIDELSDTQNKLENKVIEMQGRLGA